MAKHNKAKNEPVIAERKVINNFFKKALYQKFIPDLKVCLPSKTVQNRNGRLD